MKLDSLRGMVRPLVTMVMAGGVVGGFFAGKLSAEQFMSIALMAIGFYFVDRSAKKQGG